MLSLHSTARLGNVIEKAQEISQCFHDEEVPVHNITLEDMDFIKIGEQYHYLKETAKRQISARLGIPYKYLINCPPGLQKENIDYWLNTLNQENNLYFRFDGGDVRAIFTDKYKPIDNINILLGLSNLYGEDTPVRSIITDDIMAIEITNNRKLLVGKDELKPGVAIKNSETGFSSFSIDTFILRLVCTNGMIAARRERGIKKRHITNNFLENMDLAKTIEMVRDQAGSFVSILERAAKQKVENIDDTFEKINTKFLLTNKEQEAVTWGYSHEPGDTMYHVVNSYTRGAKYQELGPEQSLHLQEVGGMAVGLVR